MSANNNDNDKNKDDIFENFKNGTDGDDKDNDTADESTLPPITPAILEEYQKEVAMREAAAMEGGRKERKFLDVCGVPSWLTFMLIVLIIAVIIGTIVGVVFYEDERVILPPSDAPTSMATMEPS
jgi:hypothetical protein